jgi:hypothetical protein
MEEVGIWRMRTTSGHLYLEYCQYRSVVILELLRRILFHVTFVDIIVCEWRKILEAIKIDQTLK